MPKVYRVLAEASNYEEYAIRADSEQDALNCAEDTFFEEMRMSPDNVSVIEELEDGPDFELDVSEEAEAEEEDNDA